MTEREVVLEDGERVDADTGEILPATQVPAAKAQGAVSLTDVLESIGSEEALEQQKKLMAAYDKACEALIGPNDVQEESGRTFKKKSAWRKLARHFGISTEVLNAETWWEENEWEDDPHCVSRVTVRAVAPWGQYMTAVGKCSTREKRFAYENNRAKADHDCEATAQTRASNRAVSDLIAAGEVSAEEMQGGGSYERNGDRSYSMSDDCPFKKHKGEPWSGVVEEDPDYVEWLLENIDDMDAGLREMLEGALEGEDVPNWKRPEVAKARNQLQVELLNWTNEDRVARIFRAYAKLRDDQPDDVKEWIPEDYERAREDFEEHGKERLVEVEEWIDANLQGELGEGKEPGGPSDSS